MNVSRLRLTDQWLTKFILPWSPNKHARGNWRRESGFGRHIQGLLRAVSPNSIATIPHSPPYVSAHKTTSQV